MYGYDQQLYTTYMDRIIGSIRIKHQTFVDYEIHHVSPIFISFLQFLLKQIIVK